MTIADDIEKAKRIAAENLTLANNLQQLLQLYPDLRKYVGRWKKEVYCSAAVNSLVTKFELRHNCGCCADTPLEGWFYIETEFGKVYSDPPKIVIGQRDEETYCDFPGSNWILSLKEIRIPEKIINQLEQYFEDEKQDAYERENYERENEE
jgi:hypothetical protein